MWSLGLGSLRGREVVLVAGLTEPFPLGRIVAPQMPPAAALRAEDLGPETPLV